MSEKKEGKGNGATPVSVEMVNIKPPNFRRLAIEIRGVEPLCLHKFSSRKQAGIQKGQEAGPTAKTKREREPKDFERDAQEAAYVSKEGWYGLHAASFRNAAISACRTVGFKMTHAKLGIFIEADGRDAEDGTPLVRITEGEPETWISPVRNASGVIDLRARPRWMEWAAVVRVRYDADMFTEADVLNLFARIGLQVGIGEGRPDSKDGPGIGYGLFETSVAHNIGRKKSA